MFIAQSDHHRYGKLSKELKNDFTKGNNDYPTNLVSAFHLINEFKQWQPPMTTPASSRVAFAGCTCQSDDDWKKSAICHNCRKKGHIHPDCPKLAADNDSDVLQQSTDDNKCSSTAKSNKDGKGKKTKK